MTATHETGLDEANSPVKNELDNIVIFTQPQKEQGEGPWFVAAVAADPDDRIEVNLAAALPPLWHGKYQGHFVPVALFAPTELNAQLGVTHLALLESLDQGENDPFYFGHETITHNGAILWFNGDKQQYYFIHSRTHAIAILEWMVENQETWQKLASKPAGLA